MVHRTSLGLLVLTCVILLWAPGLRADDASTETTTISESTTASSGEKTDTTESTTKAEEESSPTEPKDRTSSSETESSTKDDMTTTVRSWKKTKKPFSNLSPYDRPSAGASDEDFQPGKKVLLIIPIPKLEHYPRVPSPSWDHRPSANPWDPRPSSSPWDPRPPPALSGFEPPEDVLKKHSRPSKAPFPNIAPFPSYSPYSRRPSPWVTRRTPIDDDDNVRGTERDSLEDDPFRRSVVHRKKRESKVEAASTLLARIKRSALFFDFDLLNMDLEDGLTSDRTKRCGRRNNPSTEPTVVPRQGGGDQGPTKQPRSVDREEVEGEGVADSTKSRPLPKKYRMRAAKMAVSSTSPEMSAIAETKTK